ncbi:cysteine hydrolase family protein [Saccharophagus degradans]|uniref:Cysteine hydrolase family protein n=1 Tax=Saccharophagus degradans TaxID=86304 RepID=A0AAW7X8F9_9GAMM|nr:cysteine hydrolase family protein [Saccharophagus degradans]
MSQKNNMLALIVIDQQKGLDHPKLGARNNPEAESEMLWLLRLWRERSWPIVHVKHRSKQRESVFWPEQEGFEFKEDFKPQNAELVIEKSVPCAFTNNMLEGALKRLGVSEIVIVGAATNNSVESTARTGGNLGYTVYVVEDACFTFAKPDYYGKARTADDVHVMSLANLHGEYATVLSSSQLISGKNL